MAETLYRATADLSAGTGRTIHGLAIPYGVTAEIRERGGSYSEQFAPGSFTRSIRERGSKIRLFIGHDGTRLPIGKAVDLTESARGLEAAFEVADTSAGNDALESVRAGLVDSFSIGFVPIQQRHEGGLVIRTEASLREVSLVAFPAYEGALVAGVRSRQDNTITPEQAARRLRLLEL